MDMDVRQGYSFSYWFSSPDLNEINSKQKSCNYSEGDRPLIVEMRIDFIIRGREAAETIDSERYDVIGVYADEDAGSLAFHVSPRLEEYGMSEDEINSFCSKAMAVANKMAAEDAASLGQIPLVAHLQVCTVQMEGESFDATQSRAIRTRKLTPLYLWLFQTVERKPLTSEHMDFLALLHRTRVEDIDQGLRLMRTCPICSQRPCIGDQISELDCRCAFHSHCIIRELETNNLCPKCNRPAYDCSFLDSPADGEF